MRAATAKTAIIGILAAVIGAAAGFYFGFGYGAGFMGSMSAQTRFLDSIRIVERSVDALETNDFAAARKELQISLRVALSDLSANAATHGFFDCSERNQRTLQRASGYLDAHRDVTWLAPDTMLAAAFQRCGIAAPQ